MDFLFLMLVVGVTLAARSAWQHSGNEYRASRARSLDGKAAGGSLAPPRRRQAARHHATGYWAREVAGGFPVARTGWHAGWIANRTAQAHRQAVREEARSTEAETRAGYVTGLKAHRARQRQAFTEIEQAIKAAAEPVRGRKAVRETADAVVLPFRQRTEPPAGETAEPGPRDDARPDDSQWLRPGERRCELCGGNGRSKDGTGACPACRGFGSAPSDPDAPPAPPGAVCAACGNPGRPGDPVLRAGEALTHRSHAIEQQAACRAVLDGQPPAATANGSSPATNGASPMTATAEITYDQSIAEADKIINACEAELARLRASQIAQMAEHLMGLLNDSGSIGRLSEVDDGIRQEIEAAQRTLEAAEAFRDGLQRDHGGINDAHQSAPIPMGAQPEFYAG